MNDKGFRRQQRRAFDHDFAPRHTRGHMPALASVEHYQPTSGSETRAKVKWFSPEKGFGFVALEDGSGEAFLHASVVGQSGCDGAALKPGVTLRITVGHGQKGLQVVQIINLDESAAPPTTRRRDLPPTVERAVPNRTSHMTGRVKWYSQERGFGFVAVDDGRQEVFVHATALQRSRIGMLSEGERVTLEVAEGRKGLEAVTIASAD